MSNRYIDNLVRKMAFSHEKMAFISGPRQVGKTTFARMLLTERGRGAYRNWDDRDFRRAWVHGPSHVVAGLWPDEAPSKSTRPLLVLDELHKAKGWKGGLKGIYDLHHHTMDLIVTGSARLNVFKKGGDSLLGRYFLFRLNPLSVAELAGKIALDPETCLSAMTSMTKPRTGRTRTAVHDIFDKLMGFGGFPEPYFAADTAFANLWRRGRVEKIIREDLRDLSRLPELSQVEMLTALLPERVGSPMSLQVLREDLEVAHDTVKRWMTYLEELYYFFTVRPYAKNLARSLKKEPKIYLYDWTEVEGQGPRFENLVAMHLKKACEFWTDAGLGDWRLQYLRNKEKQEVDFLITRKDRPVLTVECKYGDTTLDPSFLAFARHIGVKHHLQLIANQDVWTTGNVQGVSTLTASADLALMRLV